MIQAKDKIILALDVSTKAEAIGLVEKLKEHVGLFKVGLELYSSAGPQIVKDIQDLGASVFIDLKIHDIPNTAASTGRVMTRLRCKMFTAHASGGTQMLTSLIESVKEEANILNIEPPLVLAVTLLTSIDEQILKDDLLIKDMSVQDVTKKWANLARIAGADGMICSPLETPVIRCQCGPEFKIITPGIRPEWVQKHDQKRITTPREAIQLGSDYIVVGRAITQAKDPVYAAKQIAEEIQQTEGEINVK